MTFSKTLIFQNSKAFLKPLIIFFNSITFPKLFALLQDPIIFLGFFWLWKLAGKNKCRLTATATHFSRVCGPPWWLDLEARPGCHPGARWRWSSAGLARPRDHPAGSEDSVSHSWAWCQVPTPPSGDPLAAELDLLLPPPPPPLAAPPLASHPGWATRMLSSAPRATPHLTLAPGPHLRCSPPPCCERPVLGRQQQFITHYLQQYLLYHVKLQKK